MKDIYNAKNNLSLTTQIFRHIRDGIIDGKYQSGDYLVETKLAEELGVSRTPIREALKQLELEDLIESIPNKGVIVKGISNEDIEDIFTIRFLLEGLAAYWAATRINDQELNELSEIIALMELYTKRQDYQNLAKLDSKFHEIIFTACKSRTLKHILGSLHQNASLARQSSLMLPERAPKSLQEHMEIFGALSNHDADKAKEYIEKHIYSAGHSKDASL